MEPGGSEGESKLPPEVENKSKRKMKTASQLELLEKTFSADPYPPEHVRAELAVQLGLSDRQLQMWFCHRRLKERKGVYTKNSSKDSPVPEMASAMNGEEMMAAEAGHDHSLGSTLGAHSFMDSRQVVSRSGVALARIGSDVPQLKRYFEPQQSSAREGAIAFVEGQLGEPLRDDGPILGMVFDPLPPGAFGAPIAGVYQKPSGQSFKAKPFDLPNGEVIKGAPRALHEYQFLPEQPTVRNDTFERAVPSYQFGSPAHIANTRTLSLSTGHTFNHSSELVPAGYGFSGHLARQSVFPQQGRQVQRLTSSLEEHANIPRINSIPNIDMDAHLGAQQLNTLDNLLDCEILPEDDVGRVERKRKSEEARIAREVEAHEKRIRKELEKQDILKRKREEQIKKEMEKHNRERRKEEERLQREKQREEERYLREQRRELERKEKYLQKESIRAERMRQKEDLRREKEEARQKAANERAIVRRMAKEYVELIDDERLELMELAASSKGFSSILSLDSETLQNLDAFREELTSFPPKTVQLKRPFSVQPWHDSELSIGNLLMVWRFLIAFADALELWPFTLDEFIQAFHDYDPRLLAEVHVCLLRCIIKDIEDVARTPSSGLVVNQTSSISPGGGHPQIVEGAYSWGFSIRSWQCHLNPLTWPEILRQFALSAGFGPQLKKTRKTTNLCNDNEDNNDKDIISNLRSGATVRKAVAIMQQRGSSNLRKSRHCLTPGTVKYAAFQILALEGSMDLTIMEVAEKIQISGLRDLSTSKTPEASIAAALSRDAKLFERTAPSTYCVRPAYRKDPADADTALAAARERIRAYKSVLEDVEDADAVERDEDSGSDDAEDPNVDDLTLDSHETSQFEPKATFTNGKKTDEFLKTTYNFPRNVNEVLPPAYPKSLDEVKGLATGEQPVDVAVSNVKTILDENMNIDESNFGEPWVQGLMEGEYSNLSIEERINALVALIGIANEGNSIRVVLEERLESANALKKQMWAEVQLDKRRMKEDYAVKMQYPSTVGIKTDPQFEMSLAQARQSPFAIVDKMSPENTIQQVQLNEQQNEMRFYDSMPSEKHLQIQDLSIGLDNPQFQQLHAAEKSSSQLKSLISHKAEEMCVHRSLPLGQDRRRNRYWQFTTSASCNDPGCGIIFVELHQGHWRIIDSEEDFDVLLASLDVRGIRECHLYNMLQKIEASFKATIRKNTPHAKREGQIKETCKAVEMSIGGTSVGGSNIDSPLSTICSTDTDNLETSTSFSIELGRNENEKNNALKRYQDLEEWMWGECYAFPLLGAVKYGKTRVLPLLSVCMNCREVYCSEESCCPCYKSSGSFRGVVKFSKDMALAEEQLKANSHSSSCALAFSPNQIRLLKVQLALIEASILVEALQPLWTNDYRKLWGTKLYTASSAEELLQALTMLEQAIKGDYLSHKFETTSELLGLCKLSESGSNNSSLTGVVHVLPWLPQTTASVALRLMEFDSSISYTLHQKMESLNDDKADSSMPPSRSAVTTETSYSAQLLQEENASIGAVGFSGSCRGRGRQVRGRGRGKSQRKLLGSKSDYGKRRKRGNNGHMPGWRQESRGKGGRKRGPCTTKDRQKQVKMDYEPLIQKGGICETLQPVVFANEARLSRLRVEDDQDASTSGRSDYDDENNRPSRDKYDYYAVGKSGDDLGGSEENVDVHDGGDEGNNKKDEAEYSEDEQSHLNVEAYLNVDTDDYEEPMVDKDGEWDRDPDDTESSSSDFSH